MFCFFFEAKFSATLPRSPVFLHSFSISLTFMPVAMLIALMTNLELTPIFFSSQSGKSFPWQLPCLGWRLGGSWVSYNRASTPGKDVAYSIYLYCLWHCCRCIAYNNVCCWIYTIQLGTHILSMDISVSSRSTTHWSLHI